MPDRDAFQLQPDAFQLHPDIIASRGPTTPRRARARLPMLRIPGRSSSSSNAAAAAAAAKARDARREVTEKVGAAGTVGRAFADAEKRKTSAYWLNKYTRRDAGVR